MAEFPRASPARWWKTASIGRVHRSPHAMFVGRMRRLISISILLLLTCIIGAVWYLTNPKRLSAMSGLLLSHVLGARVTVQTAQLSWNGTLRLGGVRLRTNPGKMPSTTLFSADQVAVSFNWLGLLSGRLHASQITAVRPMLNLVDDLTVRQWNYEGFAHSATAPSAPKRGNQSNRPMRLPSINLQDAVVRWAEIRHGTYKILGQSLINAEMGPSPESHSTYRLDMEQQSFDRHPGIVLTGLYNISTREFSARINQIQFTPSFRQTLPAAVQQLWRKLHLRGSLRHIVFRVSPGTGVHVHAMLDGVSLVTVAPSRRLGPQIIPLNNLKGSVAVSGTALTIDHLSGVVLGWKFQVPSAHFDGFESGAPFHATVKLSNVNIPLPYPKIFSTRDFSLAQAIFHRLRPSGLLNITVHVDRSQLHAPPVVRGEINCKNVHARYINFPYPMDHVHGLIRFTSHHISFVNVQASAEAFPVSLNGSVAINENDGPIHLVISSPHAYFDRRLAASLPANIRPIWNRFNPVGVGAFVCDVTHAAGTRGDPRIVLHIFPQDVSGAYRDLPYPLKHVHGSLIFTDHETKIIKLEAPVGKTGHIIFTGKVTYSPRNLSKLQPMVHLQAVNVPINSTLTGSLPESWAKWIKLLHVQSGNADLDAMITRGTGGNPSVRGNLTVDQGVMTPTQLPWPVRGVTALAHISSGGLIINSVTGQTGSDGNGTLTLMGAIAEPHTGPVRVSLNGGWKNIRIAAPAPAGVPKAMADFWNKWKIRGSSNGTFTYSVNALKNPLTGVTAMRDQQYHVQVQPDGMTVKPAFLPTPLSGVTGDVDVTAGMIRMKDIQAGAGAQHLQLSGVYHTGSDSLALSLTAGGPHLSKPWMALIPGSTGRFIDGLKPRASWILELPRLQRIKVGKAYRWHITGSLVLNNLATAGDIKLKAKQATVTIALDLTPGNSLPMLDGQFDVSRLNWEGRIADPLTGEITANSSTHQITIDQIKGMVAGGKLTGQIHIHTGSAASYDVACQLHGSQLAQLLVAHAGVGSAKGIQTSTGIVDASLNLSTILGKKTIRKGNGQLVISHARIYDVPMAMGLMQIVTLRLPISSDFQHAHVRYFINNNIVRFQPISLSSPGVNLVGEGSLNLHTTDLSLRFITQSPHGTRVPLLGVLFGLARAQLLELRVSGTLAKPVIAPVPLRFLTWPFTGFGQ
ncbi:MAG: AsmA-like C-terminal region-containing protein [Phycisphaerae bacterium]